LFADPHDFDQLGWSGVQVDHVAGLLCRLRPRVHRDGDVGLREGGRIVGSVARHGHEVAFMRLLAN